MISFLSSPIISSSPLQTCHPHNKKTSPNDVSTEIQERINGDLKRVIWDCSLQSVSGHTFSSPLSKNSRNTVYKLRFANVLGRINGDLKRVIWDCSLQSDSEHPIFSPLSKNSRNTVYKLRFASLREMLACITQNDSVLWLIVWNYLLPRESFCSCSSLPPTTSHYPTFWLLMGVWSSFLARGATSDGLKAFEAITWSGYARERLSKDFLEFSCPKGTLKLGKTELRRRRQNSWTFHCALFQGVALSCDHLSWS